MPLKKSSVAKAQEENINLYQKMIEEIEDYAIVVLDENGFIRNWNRGAEKIKGYSQNEIIGQHFSIFYLQEDLDRNLPQKLITKAREQGRASHEGWRKRKDGSHFWGSVTITAIHDNNDKIIGFSKVTRDLTEKKISEDQLRMSEERYHKMITEVQDYAIILLDEKGIVQNWNAGAKKIKAYSAEEIVGRSFEIFYTAEDREKGLPRRLLNTARETGRAVQEGWRVRKDGSRFWGLIVITALHGNEGQIIGFSKVTRDLTDQKAAEEKLSAYARGLEIQNRELEQFTYVASHDLQEPLRKIQTFTGLIEERYHDEKFVREYLAKLRFSARRLSELVKSLLEYSRISRELGGSLPEQTDVDLNTVLANVQQDQELIIQEKEADIESARLPTIKGNGVQLGQVFNNLISNSLKFAHGRPRIRISSTRVMGVEVPGLAETEQQKRFYRIDVTDNGVGFEQRFAEKVFLLFQRLHDKHQYPGTGIGLALCKKIVENHGGAIEVKSAPGEGTTFSIYLPA